MQVNVMEAKTDFSKLIRLLESKREDSIIVARNGRPVIKMTLVDESPVTRRIGIAKGKFRAPEDFDANNDEAAAMLMGEESL
ncbi:MAG: hypothetical protein IJI45_12720 [Anaerolineaceae bacterium]|nr:hypothetical protein [Anaerolineaceae bacterium]